MTPSAKCASHAENEFNLSTRKASYLAMERKQNNFAEISVIKSYSLFIIILYFLIIIKFERRCEAVSDIKLIIEQILSDSKLASSKNIESKVYSDTPILRVASQMPGYIPEKYREMRAIAISQEAFGKSEAWIFVKQGRFMAEFEDNFEFSGEFTRYFPTYQNMGDRELRGYFSWRTLVRKGDLRRTSLSFAYLYIYELLNCIGFDSAAKAFDALKNFYRSYRLIDPRIEKLTKKWMCDFVVFHNLDKSLLNGVYDFTFENALNILINCHTKNKDEIFFALCTLSSYNIKASKLYKENPEDFKNVCVRAFVLFSEYHDKKCKSTLCTKLFGNVYDTSYTMFISAVFSGRNRHADCEYAFSDIHKYECVRGHWRCKKCFGIQSKNAGLGVFVKAVDMMLRRELGISPELAGGKETKVMLSVIAKAIDEFKKEKDAQRAARVEIDLSKLSDIRLASDKTCERLTVEEEFDEPNKNIDIVSDKYSVPENISNETKIVPNKNINGDEEQNALLDSDEKLFLSLLISGENYESFLQDKNIIPSIIIDGINEKMYDIFGDTAIIFDGDIPELVDEYIEELKNYI